MATATESVTDGLAMKIPPYEFVSAFAPSRVGPTSADSTHLVTPQIEAGEEPRGASPVLPDTPMKDFLEALERWMFEQRQKAQG